MTSGGDISWRPLVAGDLPLLAAWLAEPQVRRWWNHDSAAEAVERDFGAGIRGEEAGEDLVVSLDGQPVGLVQRAVIADYPEDMRELSQLTEVPDRSVEIDYLIGTPEARSRGLGSRIIASIVADTWLRHPPVPAVIVPVVAANAASWRALEKAGFHRVAEGELEPENPIDDPLHYIYRQDRPPAGGAS